MVLVLWLNTCILALLYFLESGFLTIVPGIYIENVVVISIHHSWLFSLTVLVRLSSLLEADYSKPCDLLLWGKEKLQERQYIVLAHLNSCGKSLHNNLKYYFAVSSKTDKLHIIHQQVYLWVHTLLHMYMRRFIIKKVYNPIVWTIKY